MKTEVKTNNAPIPAGPYSQAILTNEYIFVAGQGPVDPATGKMPEGVAPQTRQVLLNLQSILEAAGSGMDKVVKVSAYLSDMADFTEFNNVYQDLFSKPYPVRTTVGAQLSGILVEIDVIATR